MQNDSQPPIDDRRLRALWLAVEPEHEPHPIDSPTLGRYAEVLVQEGKAAAAREFPAVEAHLATDCQRCRAELNECIEMIESELREIRLDSGGPGLR